MGTLETILLILLVLNSIALAALVLLQQGKGADIGAAFGSGAANTVFGSSGSASFLAKVTTWLAIGFFALSLGLAFIAKNHAAQLNVSDVPVVAPAPESAKPPTTAPPAAGGAAQQNARPETLTPPNEPVDSDIPKS